MYTIKLQSIEKIETIAFENKPLPYIQEIYFYAIKYTWIKCANLKCLFSKFENIFNLHIIHSTIESSLSPALFMS